jgi:hypothetical protein
MSAKASGARRTTERPRSGPASGVRNAAPTPVAPPAVWGILDAGPRVSDWPALEARLRELGPLLERAQSLDEIQKIGRLCREIVSDLADVALSTSKPAIGAERFRSDRKAKLSAFLGHAARGSSSAALRRLVLATYDLSNTVTHSRRGSRAEAVAAAQGTVLLVRTVREPVREHGRHRGRQRGRSSFSKRVSGMRAQVAEGIDVV